MSKHTLTNINPETREAECSVCGPTYIYKGRKFGSKQYYGCGFKRAKKPGHLNHSHRLSNINTFDKTANCLICGVVAIVKRSGEYYRCRNGVNATALFTGRGSYRSHKSSRCSLCNFKPQHSHQLDVDHIDGNHKNNDPSNFITLCANCHRLKTAQQRGFRNYLEVN